MPPGVVLVITLIVLVALCLILMVVYKVAVWYGARYAMSSETVDQVADPAVAAPVAATSTEAGQLIAKPGNAGNAELAGNAIVPSEARDIIRMQAKAETVVALLKSAKMTNKAEAIELVFNCSRSGRAGSTYQQALALVDVLINPYPQRTPEQDEQRKALGLA